MDNNALQRVHDSLPPLPLLQDLSLANNMARDV
jgi:hypothetical protein